MKKILLLTVLTLLLSVEKLYAGAWTVPKHNVWGEYYMEWDYGKQEFNQDGKRQTLSQGKEGRSWGFDMEPKLEFGVTDWLTAMASVEYKEFHYKEYGRPAAWGPYEVKNHGVTAVRLGGRWRFLEDPVVMSFQTRVYIYPGYGINHGELNDTTANQPGIGYGDTDVDERLMIGKTFKLNVTKNYSMYGYWGMEGGYLFRNRHVCSAIPYFVEFGIHPTKNILLETELDGIRSLKGTGSILSDYGIWRCGITYDVFGMDSVLRKGNKLFSVGFQYGMTIWGRNTTAYNEFILKTDTQF